MKPKRGYYSLIQFCPDASRLEAVNVGVVLFCPDAAFLDARTSGDNRRAESLVGHGQLERRALNAAKRAIERRLQVDRDSFKDMDDPQKYIDTRGNWLKLTPRRPVKVFDPSNDLESLYAELVGGKSMRQKIAEEKQLFPVLQQTFEKLQSEGRAEIDKRVTIPILERTLSVPYAFSNGSLNLVKPQRFSHRAGASTNSAMRLALEGDLIKRHGTEQCSNARLIVVSSFEDESNADLVNKINGLFHEYEVKNIDKQHVDEFVVEVEQEAH
jgi:hypothetical protein